MDLCCEYVPFRQEPRVQEALADLSCETVRRPADLRQLRSLAESLQPEHQVKSRRFTSTSRKFKLDLIDHLANHSPRFLTAVELGIGSSATTILLAAMFCKVLVIDIQSSLLNAAATQRLANVVHLQMDSVHEPWRSFGETERVDFALIDGEHTFRAAKRDLVSAVDVLSFASQPFLAVHDYNIPGVRLALENLMRAGAVQRCWPIGEEFSAEDALAEMQFNPDPEVPEAHREVRGALHEGMFCEVNPGFASSAAGDVRPLPYSLQRQPGFLWQVYDRHSPDMPLGTMRMFCGASQSQGTLHFTHADGDLVFLAKWWWPHTERSRVHLRFDTGDEPQNGTLVFNRWRTGFVGIISSVGRWRRAGRWRSVPNLRAFGRQAAALRGLGGESRVYRAPYPATEIFGLSLATIAREYGDVQRDVLR